MAKASKTADVDVGKVMYMRERVEPARHPVQGVFKAPDGTYVPVKAIRMISAITKFKKPQGYGFVIFMDGVAAVVLLECTDEKGMTLTKTAVGDMLAGLRKDITACHVPERSKALGYICGQKGETIVLSSIQSIGPVVEGKRKFFFELQLTGGISYKFRFKKGPDKAFAPNMAEQMRVTIAQQVHALALNTRPVR